MTDIVGIVSSLRPNTRRFNQINDTVPVTGLFSFAVQRPIFCGTQLWKLKTLHSSQS
jgi:hypothetical protein